MFEWLFGGRKKRNAQLHAAVQSEDIAGVQQALDKGADVDSLDEASQETALQASVGLENKALVQLLLSRGANPNFISEQNRSPLIIAVSFGDRALPIVELLLAGRADPSQTPKVGPYAGKNALCIAASMGSNAILRRLLSSGAIPRILPNRATLMHMASIGGNDETIACAIVAGAGVNDVDDSGATPLHYAVSHGNKTAVVALLSHGADPEICNLQNQTAVDLARTSNKPILKLFPNQSEHSIAPVSEELKSVIVDKTAGEPEQIERIRGMGLLEFSNAYYPDVRFKNVMTAISEQGQAPFETVGAYLDAGEQGRQALLKLPNLGLSSISRLNKAIASAMLQPMTINSAEAPAAKRQDLMDQLEARFPGVFLPLLNEYANTPVSERAGCAALEADMQNLLSDDRLTEVVSRRFHGETLAEIAKSLGVSRERVRQIEKHAKQWVTEQKDDEPLENDKPDLPVPEGLRRLWFETYLRLKTYQEQHGTADVPNQWPEDSKLAAWVSSQRQKYKKNELSAQQIELLEALGFSWSLRERGTWEDRLAELAEFQRLHGHFDVPTNYPPAPKLRQFIASTQYQYRTGSLDLDRIMLLEDVGFILNPDAKTLIESVPSFTPQPIASNFKLSGRTITFTGRLETFTQDEATLLAKQMGANVVDRFTGNVDLLVVGNAPGSKLKHAQRIGIAMIDENQFISLLR